MIEASVSAGIAVIAGVSAVANRLHNRINSVHNRISELDNRIDRLELYFAQNYVNKGDFVVALEKMESHMIRIEEKLDKLRNF
jgi:hypothetical protein